MGHSAHQGRVAQVSAMYFRKEIWKLERLLSSGRPSDASFAAVTLGLAPPPTLRQLANA